MGNQQPSSSHKSKLAAIEASQLRDLRRRVAGDRCELYHTAAAGSSSVNTASAVRRGQPLCDDDIVAVDLVDESSDFPTSLYSPAQDQSRVGEVKEREASQLCRQRSTISATMAVGATSECQKVPSTRTMLMAGPATPTFGLSPTPLPSTSSTPSGRDDQRLPQQSQHQTAVKNPFTLPKWDDLVL